MRITLTARAPRGAQGIVVSGGENASVGEVAAVVRTALIGGEPLAPVISLSRTGRPGPPPPGFPPHGRLPDRPAETLWLNGGQADPRAPAARVLRDGAVVATDPQAAPATANVSGAEPSGVVEIRVVGGVAAGVVHRLGLGAITVGAAATCDIRVGGRGVPAYAAQLMITPGRAGAPLLLQPSPGPPPGAPT